MKERNIMRFLLLYFATGLFFSGIQLKAQVPSYIPINGLVGYWPFDSTALNLASTSHHGTAVNVANSMDRFGQPAKALYLNGTSSHITLPSTAMQQVTGAFTVAIWARSDTFVPSPTGHEIINDRSTSNWPYRFRIGYAYANNTTFSVDSAYYDRVATNGQIQKVGSPQPSFDGWEHYVFVYTHPSSSTATISAYRNGQFIGSTSAPNTVSGARNINIGRTFYPGSPANGLGYFKGSVDETCLWSRALTVTEIQTIYNQCFLNIQNQPTNQTASAGASVTFQLNAPTFTSFQWQIDSLGNNNWLALSNSGPFSGTNTNTLVINPAQRNQTGWKFRCFVATSNCNGYSETATLQVNCQSLINQGPNSVSQTAGSATSFQVISASSNAQYQWETNIGSGFIPLQNLGQYSGVQTNTLLISNLTFTNNGQVFRCIVSEDGCLDTSNVAALTILCQPLITQQPTNDTVGVQQTAIFSVAATSSGASYQWYQNSGIGFSALTDMGQFTGSQTAQLTISNTQLFNNNVAYRCIVRDSDCADTTNTVLLTVLNNVAVAEIKSVPLQLYPNPSKDLLTLVLGDSWKAQNVQVFDLLGKLHFEALLTAGQHNIWVAEWPAGTYLLRVGAYSVRFVVLP